jgi:HD-like signal output (HDOD) protein
MSANLFRVEQEDRDSATLSHCRRVAALAMEIGRMAGFSPSTQPLIEQVARLHHSLDMAMHPTPLGRLAWNVIFAGEKDDAGPGVPGEVQAVAGIVRLCNLVDERFEALQFDYQGVETILDEIQSFAPLEGFEPALAEHFRKMRCRDLPERIGRGDGLPVEISAARHVFRALGQEREYEVRELAAIAVRDPVLAASLIRVANSSLYSPIGKLSVVGQAIAYIGTVEARKVMLAAVLRPLFASAGLTRLWGHSVVAAQFGSALARQTQSVGTEEGLILGLVHDFGALAVQFAPRETRDRHARLVERGCPATYAERLLFGCDHGEIGADILAQWNFPDHLIEAVRFHHQPERSDGALAAFLFLVEFWSGQDEDLPSYNRVEECLSRTGLSVDALTQIGIKDGALKTLQLLA